MEDRLYWIWLAQRKIPPLAMKALVGYFGDAREVFGANDYSDTVELTRKSYCQLMDKSLSEAEDIYNRTKEIGGYVVCFNDDEYPPYLRSTAAPPMVLYIKGNHINWADSFSISVVGTRKYSDYGRASIELLTRGLVRYNAVIVTGMARGIDAIANCAALRAGGRTAAVLGCGLDIIYPPEYGGLYRAIVKNGAIITEFPPGTPPLAANFPRRNRILAGMTHGTLVGQAPIRSGALITAAHAVNEGRNVFVIPSHIFDDGFVGSNELISQGAKLVTCAGDIAEEYDFELKAEEEPTQYKAEKCGRQICLDGMSDDEIKIIKLLCNGETDADDISRNTGICSKELNSMLTMLEIEGVIKKHRGNIYTIAP